MPTDTETQARRRVAVVTGATAGVGRATVRRLAERGWDVGIIARDEERLEATVREVRQLGGRAVAVPADVADAAAMEAAADAVSDELGPIDVWVNNAFAGAIASFGDVTPEEFERITAVTYIGFVNGTRAALARMKPRDHGTIIQAGSALAFRGIPLQSAYCGAKHAIVGFTESVRTELLYEGSSVRLCEVHLPALNTPQFGWVLSRGMEHHPMPVPPIYQPEIAADAILHVADHPRRRMYVGLPPLLTVLANRIAPGALDRYLARTNVEAQQAPNHGPPPEESNLWGPVGGAQIAARGVFDDQAHNHSPQLLLTRYRRPTAAMLTALALTARYVVRRYAAR